MEAQEPYILLNDQPEDDAGRDLIGTGEIAEGLAKMLIASRSSSPFVLSVDAGWGMGKSTLLRQVEKRLRGAPGVKTVPFNAWTADRDDALESLIRSVLGELDRNVVRRTIRRLGKRRHLAGMTRLSLALVGRFLGVTRLVDELWKQFDVGSRNELRTVVRSMLSDWVRSEGKRDPDRALVVFIDDLDRCSDEVVVRICEAVKLYLDAPGLIFVIACDHSVLARGVSTVARGGTGEGRAYLEKIVQVAYRVPVLDESQIRALIDGYARQSGTVELIDETVTGILVQRTGRNPRRIKRIINSFVLEYRLNPVWQRPGAASWLVTAILLQQLYTPFYDLLIGESASEDPIGEFLDYMEVRNRALEPPPDSDPWWHVVQRVFKAHRLSVPSGTPLRLEALEERLPEFFPEYAGIAAFESLLRGIGDESARRELRSHLTSRPLTTRPVSEDDPQPDSGLTLSGIRIVCVDDNPTSLFPLGNALTGAGASVNIVNATPSLSPENVLLNQPDVLISDISRWGDANAGFTFVEQIRRAGYDGPVIFFTARITPERRQRARALGAVAIVNAEEDVVSNVQAAVHGSSARV